jgi:hypothetical protein
VLLVGLVLLIGGVGGGAAAYSRATTQYKQAVVNLQRGPVGCDTDLDFTGTGTFTFYIETKGKVGTLHGDCANSDATYSRRAGSRLPVVTLTLTDADGNEVDLARATGSSYDVGGYTGTSTRSVTIKKPARYTLGVDSDDTDFAISIGRDPKSDFDKLKMIALGAAGVGLLLGGLLTLLGLRRKVATVTMPPFPGASAFEAHDPYSQPAAPSWAPAESTPPTVQQPWTPQPPVQPPAPAPAPLPPPTWQPPHVQESGSDWSAPQQ